jgi:hypothetical protein
LALVASVAVFSWRHHSDSEFWLQLYSYLSRGEAECFYMQTFRFVEGLNAQGSTQGIREAFGIISTPGNTLFTAGWMHAFGDRTFQVVDVAFRCVLVLFSFLVFRQWCVGALGERRSAQAVALFGAAFAALHPFVLSIEVLDRNVITYALTPVLLYTLALKRPHLGVAEPALHGWIFGIIAGTGLRFLPLTYVVVLVVYYLRHRRPVRDWAVAGATAFATFAFNLLHLRHHGFHSIGETTPLPTLVWSAISEPFRTAWLPSPNGPFYLLDSLAHLGVLCAAVACFGLWHAVRHHRGRAVMLLGILGPTLIVLASQRDWIEADKGRIFLAAWWPVVAFLVLGAIEALRRPKAGLLGVVLAAGVVSVVSASLGRIVVEADSGLYERKPMYQREAGGYAEMARERFAPLGWFPGYGRLGFKLDHGHKARQDALIAWTLFGEAPPAGRVSSARVLAPQSVALGEGWVDLVIDLEALGQRPEQAVRVAITSDAPPFLDLSKPERLLDIYHKQVSVSWQTPALPITALTGRGELEALGEVAIDLNAFVSFGTDDIGFEQINLVALQVTGKAEQARATALLALPQTDSAASIRLRVPLGARVLLRNWFVFALEGTPHRVDSWVIEANASAPTARFLYAEPESYL